MVAEAEEFAEQDKAVKAKVDARNKLETYCYNMKSTLGDKLGDKLDEEEKETVRPPSFLLFRQPAFRDLMHLALWATIQCFVACQGDVGATNRPFLEERGGI